MKNVYKKSIKLHKKYGGKIETKSKIPLNSKEDLSLAYTPGVAQICEEIAKDKSLAKVYTLKKNTVAIISDGTAILGLGELGPLPAIPVMEGKACIFKEFGGVDAFPICLDTKNTEEIIKTIKQIAPVFGGINLEDIKAPKCFEIEERLRKELDIPVMHDDQWGAATVTLAALINALKISGIKKSKARVVLSGVGAAGVATGRLLHEYGITNTIFCDSHGIINSKRKDLNKEKIELLKGSKTKEIDGELKDAIKNADIFIGLSKPNLLTAQMIRTMNSKPIIFALANPNPEIMPDIAFEAGAYIVATGRSDFPNQINNSLVFPGIFKAMLDKQIPQFENKIFIKVAKSLALMIKKPTKNKIVPSMFDKNVVKTVYKAVSSFKKK